MKRDEQLNEQLKIFSNADKNTFKKRVTYKVGMKKGKSVAKTIVIVDECDAVMLRDLLAFYKATKAPNISVIGLTATAFDKTEGEEKSTLEEMGYKIYRTCKDDELVAPKIHEHIKIETLEKYVAKIN